MKGVIFEESRLILFVIARQGAYYSLYYIDGFTYHVVTLLLYFVMRIK